MAHPSRRTMRYLAALTASCALILVACERPLEPTPRSSLVHGRTAPASIAFGEHIAWRNCYTDWSAPTPASPVSS
jgi:hypothetical protein